MVPQAAIDLCKRFEGFRRKPYLCPAGIPTIGYGTTRYPDGRRVTLEDPPVDALTAEALLICELSRCEEGVLRLCPCLAADDTRRGAIMDFAYNLGLGRLQGATLRRRINQRDWPEAARELGKWVWGGGRRLPGLVLRRAAEVRLLQ